MTSMVAILPVANMITANTALDDAGFGPNNFSVPAYVGPAVSFGALHSWHDAAFEAAVQAIPNVTVDIGTGDSVTRTQALIASKSAKWGAQAPELPSTGIVTAGNLYRYGENELWSVIQTFSRTTYGAAPATYPSLIRKVHQPGVVEAWKQPIDQYDAYKLVNPFNGLPDQCTHNGFTWKVTGADGSGNNVWEPNVYGWTKV